MKRAWIMVGLLCAGCASSGGTAASSSIMRENRSALASMSAEIAARSTASSEAAAGAPIDGNADTATCADWAVTGAEARRGAAVLYAAEFDDPNPSADASSLVGIITSTCDAYGDAETPRHAAKVSIAAVYGH